MPHRVIIGNLQKKIYYPFYLLMGETPYFIDKICDYFQNCFFEDDGVRDFNQQVVYGKDIRVEDLVSMAKEYPIMAEHRLLIVKEAQELQKTPGSKDGDVFAPLVAYLKNPQKQTIMVFCYKYKSVDKRSAFFKAANNGGCVFETPKIYDNQVPKYVMDMVAEKRFTMDGATAELIASHIGTDLSRIDRELDKFRNILPEGGKITKELVETYIGISREYNGFELANALWEHNLDKSFEIIRYFSSNPKNYPNAMILAMLYSSFLKVVQYHYASDKSNLRALGVNWSVQRQFQEAVRYYPLPVAVRVLHWLKEYDLKSKGYEGCDTPDQELLKELVFRIINRVL
ncbi:MAG: DNA polymerase III subunit delta [Bacteroidales bacterium]|nr:DNA polymerase III subunit delta [Bacteroidales bacterium]